MSDETQNKSKLKDTSLSSVQFVGLNTSHIPTLAKARIFDITRSNVEKLSSIIKKKFKLIIHFKNYKDYGKKHKYTVHVHLDCPSGHLNVDKNFDWDIVKALHKGFNHLEKVLSSKLKYNAKKIPAIKHLHLKPL